MGFICPAHALQVRPSVQKNIHIHMRRHRDTLVLSKVYYETWSTHLVIPTPKSRKNFKIT
jgi:hypothetical protein